MKIITSPKFKAFNFNEDSILTNKDRHLVILNYISSIRVNVEEINIEQNIKLIIDILKQIHSNEYLESDSSSNLYEIAIEYLWLINEWIKILEHDNVFCVWYPAGHHAEINWKPWSWFCVFNNTTFASKILSKKYWKVLIIDFDLHQWNWTKDTIKWDDNIFLFSSHNAFIYPLYWNKDIEQNNYLWLHIDYDDKNFEEMIVNWVKHSFNHFKPDAIVVSAWFDAHIDDPMKWLRCTDKTYYNLWKLISWFNLPTLSILEWWYNKKKVWELINQYIIWYK